MEEKERKEEPVECPDCGALFKTETRLGTHQFHAHGKERRANATDDKDRAPGTPQPKKDKESGKQSDPKPEGDNPKETKKRSSRWFGDR